MMDLIVSGFANAMVACLPLVALVWVVLRLSKRWLNAATRYSVWWIVLCVVAVAPAFYTGLPHIALYKAAVTRVANPAMPEVFRELPVAQLPSVAPPTMKDPLLPLNIAALAPSSRIAAVCEFMVAVILARLLFSLIALQWKRRRSDPATSDVRQLVGVCLRRCGVRRRVRVAVIKGTASPMVAGPVRPMILLSSQLLDQLDAEELEQVCLHEAAHLARYDDWALLLQCVIEAVLVFHPLVYWIGRQLRLEREIACDDFVVGLTAAPHAYASCLAHVAEMACGFSSPVAAGVTDKRSHLTTRIEMLLDKSRQTDARLLLGRLASFSIALGLMVFACVKTPVLFAFAEVDHTPPPPVLIAQAVPAPSKSAPVITPAAPRPLAAITLMVAVADPLNRFVTGLDQDIFKVFEHGVERRISKFSADAERISVQIVWNLAANPEGETVSEIEHNLADLRRKQAELANLYSAAHPTRKNVDQQIAFFERKLEATLSGQELVASIAQKNPQDKFTLVRVTNGLSAALITAAENLKGDTNERQAVVIVSGTSAELASVAVASVHAGLRTIHVPVYALNVGEAPAATPGSSLSATALALVQAAQSSGGAAMIALHLADVQAIVNKAVIETHNQYALTTTVQGKNSDLEVRVSQPAGLPLLTAKIGGRTVSGPRGRQ